LSKIAEVYEHDFSILLMFMLKIKILIETRRLNEAIDIVDDAVVFARKKGFTITLLDFYSSKARIFTYLHEISKAAESFKLADEIQATVNAAPIQLSIYYRNKLEFQLKQLEMASKQGDLLEASRLKTQTSITIKKLLKTTKKAAQHRTEALRLKGTYFCLTHKPERAFKWFSKAVREGERLGAHLELSRTYFEIGIRLLQSEHRTSQLNGKKAEDYLATAKAAFKAMSLQWDLDHFERLKTP